jgi:hypothetical protein
MDAELKQYLDAMEKRLSDRLELVERKLPGAFYDWARPVELRLRTLPMFDERLALLEERASQLKPRDRPS